MIRRILTAFLLIPLAVAAVFLIPFWLFLVLINILLFLCLHEFKKLAEKLNTTIFPSTFLLTLLLPWLWFFLKDAVLLFFVLSFFITISWTLFTVRDLRLSLNHTAINLFTLLYFSIPFTWLSEFQRYAPVNQSAALKSLELIFVLMIIWSSDAAAYFIGKYFGKHKITPRISPNKSLEGFVAGIFVPAILAILVAPLISINYSWYFLGIIGIGVAFMGILGDLFESMLKRGAGIKDTSNLIPGHGGFLDRIDSLLLAFPAYYLLRMIPV
jgi:phosphatidate cytidylyltransferase